MLDQATRRDVSVRRAEADDVQLLSALAIVSFYEAYFEQDDPHDLARYLNENFAPETLAADLASDENTFISRLLTATLPATQS